MATNYLSTRTGTAGTGAGAKHAAYISGLDKYADKDEVKFVVDKNIPTSVAKDGLEFFKKADELERANGRSYRSLIIAIPREATNKLAWTQKLVDKLLQDKHAYRLAIHDKGDGNPHAHLMFSERGLKEGKTPKDFFTRQNPKDRAISHKDWLCAAKLTYQAHVKEVCPSFIPKSTGEPKIGQKLKNASPAYEAFRAEREREVYLIRKGEAVAQKLDEIILKEKTRYFYAQIKPNFEKEKPRTKVKIRRIVKLVISKPNKDGSPKSIQQIMDELQRMVTSWLQERAREIERKLQETQARNLNTRPKYRG